MSVPSALRDLAGEWAGENRLWLCTEEPARHSQATASVALAAQGRFATIRYTWAEEGQPQDGLLLLGMDPRRETWEAAWIDSWHMGDKIMLCRGAADAGGAISVRGAYAAPPGPDWGWRIEIHAEAADRFEMIMYNISPEGEEALAVEARYTRRS